MLITAENLIPQLIENTNILSRKLTKVTCVLLRSDIKHLSLIISVNDINYLTNEVTNSTYRFLIRSSYI